MSLLRIVRDPAREGGTAFSVIQGTSVVMTVVISDTTLASSPGLRWGVSLEIALGERRSTVTRMSDTIEKAFYDAANALQKMKPRGDLPSFTIDEWVAIRDELRRLGAL